MDQESERNQFNKFSLTAVFVWAIVIYTSSVLSQVRLLLHPNVKLSNSFESAVIDIKCKQLFFV